MSNTFWKRKRVLITGYEGFLGSNLTKKLLTCGANITGLDIVTQRKNTLLAKQDLCKISVIRGSAENQSLMQHILESKRIEFVFHLAAKSLVGDCLRKPAKGFSTNIKGTWNILEASRYNKKIKAIIIASSDKAYGTHKKLPYTEGAALLGSHPYDVSKSCADMIAHAYHHTYSVPAAVTRCGNIFGPGDFNFSRLIPDAMRSMVRGKTLTIRSDGKFTRDYVYVDDIVDGYLLLAEKLQRSKLSGEAFNFSYENPLSVLELVKKIYDIAGKEPNYKVLNRAAYEIRHQYLSSKKARKVLKWRPRYSLDERLKSTIDWYGSVLTK